MTNEQKTIIEADETNPLAYIPLMVWKLFVGLAIAAIFLSVFAVGYYHHASLDNFFSSEITVFLIIVKVIGAFLSVALLYIGYGMFHNARMKVYERKNARAMTQKNNLLVEAQRLKNEQLAGRIELERNLLQIIPAVVSQGTNVEYDAKGTIRFISPLSNVHTLSREQQEQAQIAGPVDFLPEPYKLSDVLQNWTPSKDGIMLAKGRELITVPPGEDLCHTTFTGNTDSGKTNDERTLLIQLLYLQQYCFLLDRNYQTFRQDRKSGAVYDYRPIERLLKYPPVTTSKEALQVLKFLVGKLDERRDKRRKAIVRFHDIYLFMDELPAFCQEEPEIMDYVGRLVREARQYGIFFVGAAQDLLNQTLKNDNGAVRDNLLTNFYGGGDATTARLVLNIPKGETIDETGLGKAGVKYLRAKGAGIERMKVRTPLADDEATHLLLANMPTMKQLDRLYVPSHVVEAMPVMEPDTTADEDVQEIETGPVLDEDVTKVVDAWNAGHTSIGRAAAASCLSPWEARKAIDKARAEGRIPPAKRA